MTFNNLNDNTLYKSSEVAKMLGITMSTLKRYYLAGKIVPTVTSPHRYYSKESIEDYIRNYGKVLKK